MHDAVLPMMRIHRRRILVVVALAALLLVLLLYYVSHESTLLQSKVKHNVDISLRDYYNEISIKAVRRNLSSKTSIDSQHEATALISDVDLSPTGKGYIIGLHACDQLTGGAMNMLCWQCLSKHLHPSVHMVEPFVRDSSFGARFEKTREEVALANNVRLSDIYSIDTWNEFTDSRGFNRFVPWEEFLYKAPRDVIFVQRRSTSCETRVIDKENLFFKLYNFKVIRSVCLDRSYSLKDFRHIIYGNFTPTSISVVVHRSCSQTISSLGVCNKGEFWGKVVNMLSVAPSTRVLHDALKYTERYLPGTKNTSYISVMVRLEHAVVQSTKENRQARLDRCLTKLSDVLNTSVSETGLTTTFMTVDAGRYGSATVRKSYINEVVKTFMRGIYGATFSFEDWENSFTSTAALPEGGHGNSGYVAMLQKVIASGGRCLVLWGGGSFQDSAFELYKQTHADPCYHKEFC